METIYLSKFLKDLDKLKSAKIKSSVLHFIELIENTDEINQISQVKKLKGHPSAYRIRIGDYRLGFFIENDLVIFARFAHRKDIYKFFPE